MKGGGWPPIFEGNGSVPERNEHGLKDIQEVCHTKKAGNPKPSTGSAAVDLSGPSGGTSKWSKMSFGTIIYYFFIAAETETRPNKQQISFLVCHIVGIFIAKKGISILLAGSEASSWTTAKSGGGRRHSMKDGNHPTE